MRRPASLSMKIQEGPPRMTREMAMKTAREERESMRRWRALAKRTRDLIWEAMERVRR